MTDHPVQQTVTRIVEPPEDIQRLNRINRAWLADDEREQRMPKCMVPPMWRGCEGTP